MILLSILLVLRVTLDPLSISIGLPKASGVLVLMIGVCAYYAYLDLRLSIGMLIFYSLLSFLSYLFTDAQLQKYSALGLFIVGWFIQFLGHYYEKARPAFLKDIKQLLIGPLFLLAEACFYFGFRQELAKRVKPLALTKRKIMSAE